MARRRSLRAHEKLLLDVIKRQAGTVEKAVLEGVMNAREAGSNEVYITLECEGIDVNNPGAVLTITDEGRGFCNEEEISEWFEQFGTPHEESENKTWAQFRMGRGQLFAFGRNRWRTGEFEMLVDIDKMGLEWELEEGLDAHTGCRIVIDLYRNPIGGYQYRSIEAFKSAIRKQIEFMEGRIFFNGEQINTPASTLTWDHEDNDAYYMFGKGLDLSFYNLGTFVMSWDAARAGVTGVVVSKQQLKVNFARNDVQSDCEVYERIQGVVKVNKVKKIRKERRQLNRDECISTLIDLRDGEVGYDEIRSLGLLLTSSGKVMSLDAIRKIRSIWTFAEYGDRVADNLSQADEAICLDEGILDSMDYRGERGDFFDWLLLEAFKMSDRHHRKLRKAWEAMRGMFRSFADLSKDVDRSSVILPMSKLNIVERRTLRALDYYSIRGFWGGRTLCIGVSETAAAWTDGKTYICIERGYLARNSPSLWQGSAALIHTMFHEWAHGEDSTETHFHGEAFYRRFHELTEYGSLWVVGDFTDRMKRSRVEDKQDAVVEKERKAADARDKKLGLTAAGVAGPKQAIAAKPIEPKAVRQPTKRLVAPDGRARRRKRM